MIIGANQHNVLVDESAPVATPQASLPPTHWLCDSAVQFAIRFRWKIEDLLPEKHPG